MNCKTFITKQKKEDVAKFLEESIKWLLCEDGGCCHYNLSDDFSLYIGWSAGWDEDDKTVFHSRINPTWCIDAAVKIMDNYDCYDFEDLDCPWDESGNCWVNSIAPSPSYTHKDYIKDAEWFLRNFVAMSNALKKGKLFI